jgi:hypothetical protein
MPAKHQPDRVYLRKVRIRRIHIFTGIQVFCLVVLWAIKTTPAAITFPLMVKVFYFIKCCFTSLTVFLGLKHGLKALLFIL